MFLQLDKQKCHTAETALSVINIHRHRKWQKW